MVTAKTVKTNNKFMASPLNHYCHDCQAKIDIKNKEIKNGVLLAFEDGGEKFTVLKCDKCFKENPGLTNFRKCEVYSRIVGYLRPVQQWNLGKKQEYKTRKEYKLPKERC